MIKFQYSELPSLNSKLVDLELKHKDHVAWKIVELLEYSEYSDDSVFLFSYKQKNSGDGQIHTLVGVKSDVFFLDAIDNIFRQTKNVNGGCFILWQLENYQEAYKLAFDLTEGSRHHLQDFQDILNNKKQ